MPIVVAASACSSDPSPACAEENAVHARFRLGTEPLPGFLDVPFPSDAYMEGGHFVGSFPGLERTFKNNSSVLAAQLALTSGWSRIAPVLFLVDDSTSPKTDSGEDAGAGVDHSTLPADEDACKADGSSVFLIDLEAPTRRRPCPCRASILDERERESTRFYVAIGPARGVVLAEGHRYAAVMTSRLKTEAGVAVGASADFTATAVKKEGALGSLYGAAYER